jgi:hypothetical protein
VRGAVNAVGSIRFPRHPRRRFLLALSTFSRQMVSR